MFHCRSSSIGELVASLRSEVCGLAVYRGVLDPPIRHFGRTRVRGLSGQCTAHQESAETKERCAGKPVAAEITHLRVVEQFVPTTFEDSDSAHLLAAAATTRHGSGDLCATHAESTDTDEHSARECDQRSERSDRTDDRAGYHCRRTRPAEAQRTQSSTDSSQPRRDCQKPGGQLAPGTHL